MSTPSRPRTREERVAQFFGRASLWGRLKDLFFVKKGLLRFGFILLIAVVLSAIIEAWNPPFVFQLMQKLDRDVVCSVPFSLLSVSRTQEARINARLETPHVYEHDKTRLKQFKARLTNTVQSLLSFENYTAMKAEDRQKWHLFLPPNSTPEEAEAAFVLLQKALEKDIEAKRFELAIDRVFQPYETNGILIRLHSSSDGNQEKISVYDLEDFEKAVRSVPVRDVLLGNAYLVKDRLNQEFDRRIAEMLFLWIRPTIPETLVENKEMTARAQNLSVLEVADVYTKFETGQVLVKGGTNINPEDYQILKNEYQSVLKNRSHQQRTLRWLGMFLLLSILLMFSFYSIHTRFIDYGHACRNRICCNPQVLIWFLVLTVAIGRYLQIYLHNQGVGPEIVPLIFFAQVATLVYSWEIAFLFAFIANLILILAGLADIGTFLMMVGAISMVVYLSRDVRRRSRLVIATFWGGITIFCLSFSIGLLKEQEIHHLLVESSIRMIWVVIAGILVTGLLPCLEKFLGILTPMRLLELGNLSHPLLQELAGRAPATYNHSIQTAVIAEAAADAIGAKSALVRVGAYFHDIGKMISPKHFTENQAPKEANIHDSLEPRISTLIIVAHVKDGIKFGRQYHLPEEIIDLIEQHHGTMLVSFFYAKANKANLEKYGQELDESEFRYPGPAPQTKEAGILMIADATESASRSIEDPTPTRIENLVRKIIDQRVEDGQFDESGLTFGELRVIEKSVINSLLASRHSRIAYPDKFRAENGERQKYENTESAKTESGKLESIKQDSSSESSRD